MGLWELFHGKPEKLNYRYAIVDADCTFIIPKAYRDTGLKEGWLEYIGSFQEWDGVYIVQYRHI